MLNSHCYTNDKKMRSTRREPTKQHRINGLMDSKSTATEFNSNNR